MNVLRAYSEPGSRGSQALACCIRLEVLFQPLAFLSESAVRLSREALLVTLLLVAVSGGGLDAQTTPPPDADLLQGIPDAKQKETAGKPKPTAGRKKGGTPASEDLGAVPGGADWLAVERLMEQAAARLSAGETAEETQRLQSQILGHLAKLVQFQQQAGASSAGTVKTAGVKQPEKPGKPPGQKPSAKSPADRAPASRPGKVRAMLTADETAAAALKEWGQLPPTVQEQLRATGRIEFLPGYERQIEAYYRRLAKTGSDR